MEDNKQPIGSPDISAIDSYDGNELPQERRASVAKITQVSSILMVLVSGLALFSDGCKSSIRCASSTQKGAMSI